VISPCWTVRPSSVKAPYSPLAVDEQAHALEVASRPGEPVFDLGLRAIPVQNLLLFGESFLIHDRVCDLVDRSGAAETAHYNDRRPEQV
jgi:hypothetical protein